MKRIYYVLFFYIFIAGLGLLSFRSLMSHYINDEEDLHEWVPELGSKLETDIDNNFFRQFDFVNFNGFMARIIGKHELNGVIKLDNGYLTVPSPYYEDEEIADRMDQVIALNGYLEKKGIPFIFTITPNTSGKYDPQLPVYAEDPGNDNLDRIAEALRAGGVNVIDYRDELQEDGLDAYDMMYRTDHHWNTKMGFYAYCKIADILEDELDCTIDPQVKDIESYTIRTYKRWHLGSRGQRTGKYYGGVDDFDLIVPEFETSLTECESEREGGYRDLLVDTDSLRKKDLTLARNDINERSIYDRVLECSQGDYVNHLSANDKKILITGDSFAKAVCPFMDISFANVRWDEGPVEEYDIIMFEPDAVVMIYDLADNLLTEDFDYEWTYQAEI